MENEASSLWPTALDLAWAWARTLKTSMGVWRRAQAAPAAAPLQKTRLSRSGFSRSRSHMAITRPYVQKKAESIKACV